MADIPFKYLASIVGLGILVFTLFILTAKAFPEAFEGSRINTWVSRVENFSKSDAEANYQANKAKIAVASGELYGRGPGKSNQKNFLPQSSSDFIYAIIVEEYGLIGGMLLLILYLGLLFRIVIVANKTETIFGTLLVPGRWYSHCFSSIYKYGRGRRLVSGNRTTITADERRWNFHLDDLLCIRKSS